MSLVVLIGASGSGKTTIAAEIERRFAGTVEVFFFDHIGVPPVAAMIAEFGSGEAWQAAKTTEWLMRLAKLDCPDRRLLFEGQTRLSLLEEGARAAGGLAYRPVLVDCDDATRTRRLIGERQQPELANADMMTWARYLRREARKAGCPILDTSQASLDESVAYVWRLWEE